MAKQATLTTNNGDTTLTLAITLPTATMLKLAGTTAKYEFLKGWGDHGTEKEPIVFDDLTNQEKADIMLDRTIDMFKDEAKTQLHADRIVDEETTANIAEMESI